MNGGGGDAARAQEDKIDRPAKRQKEMPTKPCSGCGVPKNLRPALAGGSLPSLVRIRKQKYPNFFGVQLVTSSLSLLSSINTHLITLVPDSCSFQIDNTLSRPA